MKNLNEKSMCRRLAATMTTVALSVNFAFAAPDFQSVVQPIVELLNALINPLLLVVGAVGALYCILLGVKYARAEEPQDREKAKAHLKAAIIGYALIFILMVVLKIGTNVLTQWAGEYVTELK